MELKFILKLMIYPVLHSLLLIKFYIQFFIYTNYESKYVINKLEYIFLFRGINSLH